MPRGRRGTTRKPASRFLACVEAHGIKARSGLACICAIDFAKRLTLAEVTPMATTPSRAALRPRFPPKIATAAAIASQSREPFAAFERHGTGRSSEVSASERRLRTQLDRELQALASRSTIAMPAHAVRRCDAQPLQPDFEFRRAPRGGHARIVGRTSGSSANEEFHDRPRREIHRPQCGMGRGEAGSHLALHRLIRLQRDRYGAAGAPSTSFCTV